ncbi:MAG: hypothetical protein AB7S38_07050 [Vulcanimicrobiota bacterium]
MTLKGTLKRSDLEGGVWVFEADSGERFHLEGLDPAHEKDGARLELEGDVDAGGVSIGMMGSVFAVRRAKSL